MQTITERTEDIVRELCVRARLAAGDVGHAVAERAREQRGQTAAEYMGILLIVALIIVALVGLDLDDKIGKAAEGAIDDMINESNEKK